MAGAHVSHFEIQADDPARCCAFYTKVFGWQVKPVPFPGFEYWTVAFADGEPIKGGIMRRVGPRPVPMTPVNAFTSIISVTDLARTIADILANGGTLTTAAFIVPGVGWRAFASDPEGNLFGLLQPLN
jgi:predicted enzyme related to lactoylglutathione lyase